MSTEHGRRTVSPPDGLLEVGRIGRPHGVRGDVTVQLVTDRLERLAPGSRLHDGHGWHEVTAARPQPPKFVVHLRGIDDRTAAEQLTNRTLYAEPLPADDDTLWVHELIGADVVDQHGVNRGRCVAVLDNPAHDLLELDSGHLVPVTFVTGLDGGTVRIDAPDGLFDEE